MMEIQNEQSRQPDLERVHVLLQQLRDHPHSTRLATEGMFWRFLHHYIDVPAKICSVKSD